MFFTACCWQPEKKKEVSLTEAGEQFAKTTVLPLMAAEQQSFSDLSEREQLQMLTLMQKHQDLLRMELERAACTDPKEEQHV